MAELSQYAKNKIADAVKRIKRVMVGEPAAVCPVCGSEPLVTAKKVTK